MTLQMRTVTEDERAKIEQLTRARAAPVRLVTRARIIQLAATGQTAPAIATQLALNEKCVRLWIRRFAAHGLEGLEDAPRSGRPRTYDEAVYGQVRRILRAEHLKWQKPRTWLDSDGRSSRLTGGDRPALHAAACGQHGDLPR